MKRILLSCCVMMMACSAVMAQGVKTSKAPAVHNTVLTGKTAFTSKTNEFETAAKSNNHAKVQSSFDEVKSMMQAHMGETKTMAMQSKNKEEQEAAFTTLKKQQIAYAEIMKLSKDMTSNHAAISEKLKTFSEAY